MRLEYNSFYQLLAISEKGGLSLLSLHVFVIHSIVARPTIVTIAFLYCYNKDYLNTPGPSFFYLMSPEILIILSGILQDL
jgi:hypothetical protein